MSTQEELDRRLEWLSDMLDRRGADLDLWPAADRNEARALLAEAPRANALITRARSLDSLLSSVPAIEPSATLRRRVAEIPLRQPRAERFVSLRSLWPFASISRAIAFAAVLLSIGAALGLGVSTSSASADDGEWDDFGDLLLSDSLQTDSPSEEVAR